MLEAKHLLSRVTGDRLRHELDHIINEPLAIGMMDRLSELGLLQAIHPSLGWDDWLRDRCGKIPLEDPGTEWSLGIFDTSARLDWKAHRRLLWYCLWLMRLSAEKIEAIGERIHYPRSQTLVIISAHQIWKEVKAFKGERASRIVAYLDEKPLLAVFVNCLAYQDTDICGLLRKYLTEWRFVKPHFDGEELRQRGIPPGPVYRQILSKLRNAWLDEEVTSLAQEAALLEKVLERVKRDLPLDD